MDFWETIAGHELANTLQTEIPELAESLDTVNKQSNWLRFSNRSSRKQSKLQTETLWTL